MVCCCLYWDLPGVTTRAARLITNSLIQTLKQSSSNSKCQWFGYITRTVTTNVAIFLRITTDTEFKCTVMNFTVFLTTLLFLCYTSAEVNCYGRYILNKSNKPWKLKQKPDEQLHYKTLFAKYLPKFKLKWNYLTFSLWQHIAPVKIDQ